ncbi:MAG: M15 family metallopeptidase [Methylococcaceae bacterium]|nr:M15 family metallopeptidase [Methylococcaceae bacterium]MCI0668568.1 M15 family metallopeptidase [Methylococcaceae bacterium]MCI0734567.1 M15 family metallopeptidase [Methylococcaceae bacterium]
MPELIADVLQIRTNGGQRVFEWGGSWESVKDSMHFEIDVSPEDLAAGIDTTTLAGWDEPDAGRGHWFERRDSDGAAKRTGG